MSFRRFTGLAGALAVAASLGAARQAESAPAATPAPDPRFGVVELHDAPEFAAGLGATWGRARFHWASVQPNGPDEWVEAELTTSQLTHELGSGREVVGLLIGIPAWARDAEGLPRGLSLPPDDPANLWAGFVRQAVTRYAGRIDHWIIWNEPDIWDADHPAFSWPGDVHDYVRLLKVAYQTAREANPQAVIHLAAVSHWWDVEHGRDLYFPRLLDAISADPDAADNGYFYDVATMHLYFNPASVYEVLEQYQALQAERGLDKPIWLVETNAAPSSDPAWPVDEVTFDVSLLEQAAYMPQGIALALAAGVERVAVYKLIDTPGDTLANPEPFGLVRADGSPRPAFSTARVAFQELAGAERVTWNERHVVAQVVVEQPGRVTRLLWVRVLEAQVVELPALAASATLVDMWGNRSQVAPTGGTYRIALAAGECQETIGDYCMIGGPPVYLIEEVPGEGGGLASDSLPGLLSVSPLPSESAASAPTGGGSRALRWILVGAALLVAVLFEVGLRRRLLGNLQRGPASQEGSE